MLQTFRLNIYWRYLISNHFHPHYCTAKYIILGLVRYMSWLRHSYCHDDDVKLNIVDVIAVLLVIVSE